MPRTTFTSGPLTAGTAADGGGGGRIWANPSNAKVEDAVLADSLNIGPGGGAAVPNQLLATNFGFALPSNAIIDGIKLEIKSRADIFSTPNVFLIGSFGSTAQSTVSNPGWINSLAWNTYGGPTDKWGRTWTAAEINASTFGASLSAFPGTGAWNANVDSVRITVYWHYSNDVSPADVPKRYLYKVFNDGYYLGNLPKVTSQFGFPLDINSAGAALTIECGLSADRSALPGDRLVTEAGDPITTEAGEYIYTDGQPPLVSRGNAVDPTIIQNGNRIEVWEYSYYYPNGKLMYKGQINRIEAGYGTGADNKIRIGVLSDGLDLDNYIARGAPFSYTDDQSQTTFPSYVTVSEGGSKGAGWNRYGQSFIIGAGVTKLGAIRLYVNGIADVTVTLYEYPNSITPLGSVTQHVDTFALGAPQVITFGFGSLIDVAPGGTYFFAVSLGSGQTLDMGSSTINPYANGAMYNSNYGGGSGGGSWAEVSGNDLYFVTAAGLATTTATYTGKDPTTEMFKPIIDDYRLRGGILNYSTASVDATGLALTVTFNTETILDAMKKILSVCPSGFYFYADLGTDTIYFKRTLTTPTYKLIKGRHLNKINFVMSIENVKNDLLFSGAEVSAGPPPVNLYTEYEDQTSESDYGRRIERKSDNRVSIQATADAIGSSFITENKDEYFETTVTILDRTMDITLFRPGQTVGLRGFGNFVDSLVLQIVRMEYSPNSVNLTLGNLPKRFTNEFESVIRGLIAQQTVSNPAAPS